MLYNEHNYKIKLILFVLAVFLICIIYIVKITAKYYSFCKYLDYINSDFFSKIVLIIHIIFTVISTLQLSNFFKKDELYKDIFNHNPALEYIILMPLFTVLFIVFGIGLNLIFCEKKIFKNENKNTSK